MVDYFYHNRDEGSLYFRVRTPGQGWEDEEYRLHLILTSPDSYIFHKTGDNYYGHDGDDVSPHPDWTRDLFPGDNVTYVLYYGQREPSLGQRPRRRWVKKADRVVRLYWDLIERRGRDFHEYDTITSRIHARGKDVDVRLDQGVYEFEKEE